MPETIFQPGDIIQRCDDSGLSQLADVREGTLHTFLEYVNSTSEMIRLQGNPHPWDAWRFRLYKKNSESFKTKTRRYPEREYCYVKPCPR